MKRILLLALFCLVLNPTQSFSKDSIASDSTKTEKQNSKWEIEGILNLNVNWLNTTKEWQSGANKNITLRTDLTIYANKKIGNFTSNNQAQIIYGWIKDDQGDRKNADQLWLRSVLSRPFKLSNAKWLGSGEIDFRSQLQPGFKYTKNGDETIKTKESEFLSPATIKLGIGATYRRNEHLNIMVSAIQGKITVVLDDSLSAKYGLDEGKYSRSELGLGVNVQVLNWAPHKNINYQGNLAIFTPYKEMNHTDINYNSDLKFKFNDFISLSLNTQIIYDHDVKFTEETEGTVTRAYPALQVLNNLSLAFSLDWSNKKEEVKE